MSRHPPIRSESKTTDSLDQQQQHRGAGKAKSATPVTSMSLDATKGSRPRSKVHQALAIAASINNGEMKGTTPGQKSGSATRNNSKSENNNSSGDSGNGGGDYEGSKAASKVSSSSASRREEEEMRQMVADLDRFDANDENDNLEDSF